MGRINQGRDQTYSCTLVYKGREFRSVAARDAYISDGTLSDSRQTKAGKRPIKRKP